MRTLRQLTDCRDRLRLHSLIGMSVGLMLAAACIPIAVFAQGEIAAEIHNDEKPNKNKKPLYDSRV